MMAKHKNTFLYLMTFFCFALLIFCAFLYQNHEKKSLILNMPYHDVREIIIQNGWKPYEREDRNYDTMGFHAEDLIKNFGYIEVDACSGTGMGYCQFYFKNKHGVFLRVTSKESPFPGYDPDIDGFDYMAVFSYGLQYKVD
ncbi:MAG: hypothetical protein COB76_07080 [Alphaproteobacteria bacterium]|nr:MAG: hypothetical protein COB76_07080 [Alphaproteobacteria bacterium]